MEATELQAQASFLRAVWDRLRSKAALKSEKCTSFIRRDSRLLSQWIIYPGIKRTAATVRRANRKQQEIGILIVVYYTLPGLMAMWTSLSLCLSMSLSLRRLQDKSANATLAIISPRRPHTHIILDPLRVSQICMSLVCPSEREMLLFSPCDGLVMASARVFVFRGFDSVTDADEFLFLWVLSSSHFMNISQTSSSVCETPLPVQDGMWRRRVDRSCVCLRREGWSIWFLFRCGKLQMQEELRTKILESKCQHTHIQIGLRSLEINGYDYL